MGGKSSGGKTMIPSSHRTPRNKAIAEALAMIANAHPETMAAHESNDLLWEDAAEFCAALERLSRECVSTNGSGAADCSHQRHRRRIRLEPVKRGGEKP
jgi:hypothetical protein